MSDVERKHVDDVETLINSSGGSTRMIERGITGRVQHWQKLEDHALESGNRYLYDSIRQAKKWLHEAVYRKQAYGQLTARELARTIAVNQVHALRMMKSPTANSSLSISQYLEKMAGHRLVQAASKAGELQRRW